MRPPVWPTPACATSVCRLPTRRGWVWRSRSPGFWMWPHAGRMPRPEPTPCCSQRQTRSHSRQTAATRCVWAPRSTMWWTSRPTPQEACVWCCTSTVLHSRRLCCGEDRGALSHTQFREILAFQVQRDGLANGGRELVQGGRLSDDRQVETLGDILLFAAEDAHLNGPLHRMLLARSLPWYRKRRPRYAGHLWKLPGRKDKLSP